MDYLQLLRSLPGLFLFLEPREPFLIVDASDAYLRATLTKRDRVIGKPLFEVFPDNPGDTESHGVANLRASLLKVLATGKPHTMAVQKYDIQRPAEAGGGFEERWWSPVNAPYLDAEGRVQLLIHRVEDSTELVRLRRAGDVMRADAEQELRATEVLESITEGFFALDREYRFTYLNGEAERILDKTRDEVLGKSIWDTYPGLAETEFGRTYRSTMETGVTEAVTPYYEPHRRWYAVHAYPSPRGISVYFRNVTAQREAEQEMQRLAAESDRERRIYEVALNNTPDLIYIFDLQHRFVYANEALLAMWGVPMEEALGKRTWDLGYPDWHAEMHDREIEQVIATRKPIHGEVPFEGTNGRRFWEYIFAPVIDADGNVVAIAGTARDTTDRRNAEDQIADQAAKLRESDRAKDEFIATLSHELRNPLAPLRNSVALLRMKAGADDGAASLARVMERQVDHLVRLVDDLLEISRVSRGDFSLRKERVQVGKVVRNALETSAAVLEAKKHVLDVQQPAVPVWVDADAVRLAQVIANLVDNAAKYTPEGGRIEVSVATEGATAVVSVKDNGGGISEEGLDRIFEMFNRGDRSSVSGDGGLGIGLSLARRLVQLHGGTLTAESDGVGKGSRFTLRIPLSTAPAQSLPLAAPRTAMGSKRILVVDDNRDAAETLGLVLQQLGAEVHLVHDGRAALEAFPEFQPSAVLLDIGMPEMDGYEVARRLRENHPESDVALIALTGWGQEQDRSRAREAGFDHHIVKPADLDQLQQLLSSV